MEQWRNSGGANVSASSDIGYRYGVRFGGRKAHKDDPPNSDCELVCSIIILELFDRSHSQHPAVPPVEWPPRQ